MKKDSKGRIWKLILILCVAAIAGDLIFIGVTMYKSHASAAENASSGSGSSVSSSSSEGESGESGGGSVIKTPTLDREPSAEDQTFLSGLHSVCWEKSGTDEEMLYKTITMTGDSLGEEQNYAVTELEELVKLCFEIQSLNNEKLAVSRTFSSDGNGTVFNGLDFIRFIDMCGIDTSGSGEVYMKCSGTETVELRLSELLKQPEEKRAVLAFSEDGNPLESNGTQTAGPIAVVYEKADGSTGVIQNVTRIVFSGSETCDDPLYGTHNRAPHNESADITFTVNIYKGNAADCEKSVTFTTAQLEELAAGHPEAVRANYYGTIGNDKSKDSMGVDGWFDYFRGIDLWWLLTNQVGIESTDGSADFYSRDNELYTTVSDLNYLNTAEHTASDYYTLTRSKVKAYGCTPMIAFTKNGYPILPKHDHKAAGYHAYNQLNDTLEGLGVSTEIGVIKNHNGPFIACLGNLDGYYGGYEVETGGDCVRMDIHLNE